MQVRDVGVPQPAAPPDGTTVHCQWVFSTRLRFLLQINLRSILQHWLTFCAWEGAAGILSSSGFVLRQAWLLGGRLSLANVASSRVHQAALQQEPLSSEIK